MHVQAHKHSLLLRHCHEQQRQTHTAESNMSVHTANTNVVKTMTKTVKGNSPDGETITFKNKTCCPAWWPQTKRIHLAKKQMENTPSVSLLPHPLSSYLSSPCPHAHKHTHSRHRPPFPLFPTNPSSHAVLWSRCRQHSRNRGGLNSVHPRSWQKEKTGSMRWDAKNKWTIGWERNAQRP